MDIWRECKDSVAHKLLSGTLVRVVESQEQVATNNLVETLDEQHLLEQLLEGNKPLYEPDTSGLHYLLATPFRYPPLKYGSRFGKNTEPALFYGARQLPTALAETAYYRLVFWRGMAQPPPSGKFVTQHTVFGAAYHSGRGLSLQLPPFDKYREQLSDPGSYQLTQQLGSEIRAFATEAIEFVSARDSGGGINVALFTAKALASKSPAFQQSWLCETSDIEVAFYSSSRGEYYQFDLEQFMVDGLFPTPSV